MTLKFSPGIRYLSKKLHILLGPPAIALAILYWFDNVLRLSFARHPLLQTITIVLSWPAIFYIGHFFRRWAIHRRAAELGAALPKSLPVRWPAGLDLVLTMVNLEKNGYLGMIEFLVNFVPIFSDCNSTAA